MKIFILIGLLVAMMPVMPAHTWDDDHEPRRKRLYDPWDTARENAFDKPKDRGPFYEEPPKDRGVFYERPVRREDRIRTYTPAKPIEPFHPGANTKKPPPGSAGHGVLRGLESVR